MIIIIITIITIVIPNKYINKYSQIHYFRAPNDVIKGVVQANIDPHNINFIHRSIKVDIALLGFLWVRDICLPISKIARASTLTLNIFDTAEFGDLYIILFVDTNEIFSLVGMSNLN